jgi:hypothetical protein
MELQEVPNPVTPMETPPTDIGGDPTPGLPSADGSDSPSQPNGWKNVLSQTSELVKSLDKEDSAKDDSLDSMRQATADSNKHHVEELVEQQKHGRSHQKTQNVFVQLADRVKQLEINQSLAIRYLEDVTARSLVIFKDARDNLARIKQQHVELSQAVHAAAVHGASMQGKFEADMSSMIEAGIHLATQNMTAQLMLIQQTHRENVLAITTEAELRLALMCLLIVFLGFVGGHCWVTRRLMPRYAEKTHSDIMETLRFVIFHIFSLRATER